MKEYAGNASNVLLAESEDLSFTGRAEVVILVAEPSYQRTMDGIVRQREISDIRLMMGAPAIREFANHLTELAGLVEAAEHKANGFRAVKRETEAP